MTSSGLSSDGLTRLHDTLIVILLTNAMWTSPRPPDVALDFLTSAYAAIDD